MLAVTRISISLLGWFLLMHSFLLAADLFQWTDENGVIHFTDSFYAVPDSVRRSENLIVRANFLSAAPSDSHQSISGPVPPAQPKVPRDFQPTAEPPGPAVVTYPPQEVTIIVVNSNTKPSNHRVCGARHNCEPAFRADFNNRQYIHPSVFAGESRGPSSLAVRRPLR